MKIAVALLCLLIPIVSLAKPHHTQISEAKGYAELTRAYHLWQKHQTMDAAKIDLQVIEMKGVPIEIHSSALLLMGHIALSAERLEESELAYKLVVQLKGGPIQDKKTAQFGLKQILDLRSQQDDGQPKFYN